MGPAPERLRWCVLIHSLPPKPAYLRAKVRNRLRKAGAIALKDAVYVLPASAGALEQLQEIAAEAAGGGGNAYVCEARFQDPDTDAYLSSQFESRGEPSLIGRIWVTRRGVQIDRIASAWLIRRFLDPKARFRFIDPGEQRKPGELRFDMPGGDFTHEGDNCTFETLVARVAKPDRALREIAQIVHAIDLKDDKFERAEAPGIERILLGIVLECPADEDRLKRGFALFDDLYASFRRRTIRK
ncbi:MAG: chromate resistance protein ChrB domain-containing protein [Thermoanaerobaculia bacterium]